MKKGKILGAAFGFIGMLTVTLSFSACQRSENAVATKIKDIPTIEKYFVSGKAESCTMNVDLSEYVNANGASVTYDVVSSGESVNACVKDDTLSIMINDDGQSALSVNVNSDGVRAFSFRFEVVSHKISKVYCVGDSLTAGHSFPQFSYPTFLGQALGETVVVENCGVNGAQITGFGGLGADYRYDGKNETADAYARSLEPTPDVVLVMLGTNDAKGWIKLQAAIDDGTYEDKSVKTSSEAYEKGYKKLIDTYLDRFPESAVIAVVSPPTISTNKLNIPNDTIKNEVNPVQRKVIDELQLKNIDARVLFESKMTASKGENTYEYISMFRDDGVHFSSKGATFLANAVADYIYTL